MVTVGLNFTKVVAERKTAPQQNVNVNTSVNVITVTESSLADPKKTLLKFGFSFGCNYDPDIGKITLDGELLEIYDHDVAKKILAGWDSDKNLPADMVNPIINTILARSNIEALIISREVGLPAPFALPRFEVQAKAPANAGPTLKVEAIKKTGTADSKPEPKKEEKKKK